MDEETKPKAWNFDSEQITNAPEMQRLKPVSWSAVGENMVKDVNENHAIKWYFNTTAVLAILLISFFVSNVVGAVLVLVYMGRIILATLRSNRSPSKTGSIIGWSVMTVLFLGLVLVV